MTMPYLGETFALLAALTWAFSLVLFKKSGESIPPLSLSLFKNVVGITLLSVTLLCFGAEMDILWNMEPRDFAILVLSGVLGIAIADTMLFYALNLIGVGMIAIVECTYAPSVVVVAWLFLGERITVADGIGGCMVLSAVLIVSGSRAGRAGGDGVLRTPAQLLIGILLGVGAIELMALGIVVAKPIIEETPLVPVTLIRLAAGTSALAVFLAASRRRRMWYRVFAPSAAWKTCIPASILSTYLAMLFWVGGFKYTEASVAAILNQSSTIMALGFATLFLRESITGRKLMAAATALVGILIVTLA